MGLGASVVSLQELGELIGHFAPKQIVVHQLSIQKVVALIAERVRKGGHIVDPARVNGCPSPTQSTKCFRSRVGEGCNQRDFANFCSSFFAEASSLARVKISCAKCS